MIYVIMDLKTGQKLHQSVTFNEASKAFTVSTFNKLKAGNNSVSLFIARCNGTILAKVA